MKFHSLRFGPALVALFFIAACGGDTKTTSQRVEDDDVGDDETAGIDDDVPSDDDTPGIGDDDADDDAPGDDDVEPTDGRLPDPHAIPDDASAGELQCAMLASQCHAFDRGTGDLGDRCHDIGHTGGPDECIEAYDECIAFCTVEGGAQHEGDAGHSMCEELGQLCHDLDTGPDAGLARECHQVGHDGDEAACSVIYGECVELCGGHHGNAG